MIKEKFYGFSYKAIAVISIVLWGFIVYCDFFLSGKDYFCKKSFALSNVFLLIIGSLFIFLLYFGIKKCNTERCKISVATFVLFVLQIYIFSNIMFRTETWDAEKIYWNATMLANGESYWVDNSYFSSFPNNQCIVLIQALLIFINNEIGILGTDNGLMLIVIVQCIISSYAGKCLYDILIKITRSDKLAWLGWILYVFMIGLSGWNLIAYTDIISIAFPLIILKLYLTSDNSKSPCVNWILIIVFSYLGFKIKPTSIIVTIAILFTELIYAIRNWNAIEKRVIIRNSLTLLCLCAVILGICTTLFSYAVRKSGLYIDDEANTGPLHMIMMGLNSEDDGGWYGADVAFSQSFTNIEQRTEAQKEVISQRLKDYGVGGLINHLERKSLVIFNDGTFAWGCEGGFYDIVYPDRNLLISPILKNIYYNEGNYFLYSSTALQMLWIVVLFGSILITPSIKDKCCMVIVLSLIGIVLFNYIFEARARYILIYIPFFIIAFILSIKNIEAIILRAKAKKIISKAE